MHTNTPSSPYSLDHVSNDDLHAGSRRLVGRSNQVLAALLAHLAEVDARGIHRLRYVDLLEQARDLLAHAVPNRALEEVHLRAMRTLVTELRKRTYAATGKPRSKAMDARRNAGCGCETSPDTDTVDALQAAGSDVTGQRDPRRRGRYVPAAVRRAVWERDGGRCTYVDATGERCRETGRLEFDHMKPYACGGTPTVPNMRLRCPPHNTLAAEEVFGRELMERKKGAICDRTER